MSQPIRGQGGHFVFPLGPKNTNLGSPPQFFGRKTETGGFTTLNQSQNI